MIWLTKAWEWLKKNWKWLLFPVGILLFILGRSTVKKNFTIVSPELTGAEHEKIKAREEAELKVQKAKDKRRLRLFQVNQDHEETIEKLTDEQKVKVDELQDDPEELNAYLLDVGKDIRS